jgi:hypothetical protein
MRMNKKVIYAGMALMVMALASAAPAESILVSSFETGLDGWYTDTWTAGTISSSTTGATAGTQAMLVEGPGDWQQLTKVDVKPHMAALANKGVKITADFTAFEADMTTASMQVGVVLNCEGDDNNGANNNLGWNDLGLQDLPLDGQPHTLTWALPDDVTTKIAGADDNIGWFEILLTSYVDPNSTVKFYVDNVQISYEAPTSSVLVSSFETGLDGWYDDDWTAGTIAVGTTGATEGTQAMQVEGPGEWQQLTKVDVKPYMADLANKGVKITADFTAFEADMTTTWMQVGMVLNCQNSDDNGANNNLGWIDLGSQDLPRDGQPHTLSWALADDVVARIAGADDNIGWFEFLLVSNVDPNSTVKFYVDNVQIVGIPIPTGKSTDLVIGNFEQSMDGWVVGGAADVLYSDVNGVTLDNYSLDVFVPTGAWAAVLTMDLLEPNNAAVLEAFRVNTKITADITHLVANWPVDDIPPWNGTHLIINTDPAAAPGVPGDGYLDLGYRAGWSQNNGDRTDSVTWDYSQQINAINANFDKVTYLQLQVIVNANSADYAGWVWFYLDNIKLSGGGIALNPQPASGAKEVDVNTQLRWSAGTFATQHNLYLGTSQAAVNGADGASDPSVTFVELDGTSFDPNDLQFNTQYYWRVDEVNEANPDSPWKGLVWNFTTANAIMIDQFEQYTDNSDANEAIYQTWADGWTDEIYGGSQVGYTNPPFTEQTTVHGGRQSMPFQYDNTILSYSEAKRTWDTPQDWTLNGYNTLKLYIHGNPGNGADPLYIKVEDGAGNSTTVTYPDTNIVIAEDWTEWLIPLTTLTDAGVDVTAVTGLTIGMGQAGAPSGSTGILFIDDIQVGVMPLGLVAYYALESDLKDSSGNGHDGTFVGDPNFPASYVTGPAGHGKGMLFEGTGGHQSVECGTFNPSAATGKLTVALWAKWDGPTDQWQGLMGKRDGWAQNNMMWHIEVSQDNSNIGFASYTGGCYPNVPLPQGQWTHVAVTHDGTNAVFYINGAQAGTGSFAFSEKTTAAVRFGSDDANGGNAFNGALDEIRIYDYILTPAEIQALAQ